MENNRPFGHSVYPSNSHWSCFALLVRLMVCVALIFPTGCQRTQVNEKGNVKPPKPVSVMTLNRTKQIQRQMITGTIAPWKTEQIGFEVSGRVSFVIEKNDEVQPVLPSDIGAPPTPLATIDSERFSIAVQTAEADKQVAEKRLEANHIAITQRIPAAIESAESELKFAQAEFERATRIEDAISRSEFDAARNRLRVAQSSLASAEAELAQARAEQATLESQVQRHSQAIKEANRSLRNTTLYSSFRGIVSEVHAVAGSFVNPGDPVATVQMMDPMLVQFEVSPNEARRYAKGDILDVLITNNKGKRQSANGMVYTVDAVADSNSRTYTVTLHIRNHKESVVHATNVNGTESNKSIARTRRIFSLDVAPVVTGGQQQLIEQSCLQKIGEQTVVWKITNRKANQASDPKDRVLMVEPVKVTSGTEEITLLGQWKFVPVEFADPSAIDLENDLVTGKLVFPEETIDNSINDLSTAVDPWAPRAVMLEQQRWALRAGDVVQVVSSDGSLQRGHYIPMKAVMNENGKAFVHVVERNDHGEQVARRVGVQVQNQSVFSEDTIRVQVLPLLEDGLVDGMQVVIGGSHYLTDGARVNVVEGAAR